MLRLPVHFVNLVTVHLINADWIRDFLESSRGRVYISLRSFLGTLRAVVQLAPPADGVLCGFRIRALHGRVGRARQSSFCKACFHAAPDNGFEICPTCHASPLCPRCILASNSGASVCIFCIPECVESTAGNMMCVKRFWFEAGSESVRCDYAYPPDARTPISKRCFEI